MAFPEQDWYRPSAFEVAAGWVDGLDRSTVVRSEGREAPAATLRHVLREELLRGPCIVPFSGGRDSSLVLAVACDVAREAGTELPTALTFRYPELPEAEESSWQDLVMEHLAGLGMRPDWRIRKITDEFDVVGPLVAPLLAQHRHVLWPQNIASAVAVAREASGATILSGEHGDEVLGLRRAALLAAAVRRRGRGLNHADLRALGWAATPGAGRATAVRLGGATLPWLNAAGRRRWRRMRARDELAQPLRWDRAVRRSVAGRGARLGMATIRAVSAEAGSREVAVLGDERFIASFASAGGATGIPGRGAALRLLAADLLPETLIRRSSKASFNGSRFHRYSRELMRHAHALDEAERWVDPEGLRQAWAADIVHAGTAGLVQAAWLEQHGLSR